MFQKIQTNGIRFNEDVHLKKEEVVRIAGVEIEVANGIARRRQISPSMWNGIPSAFSRNCLAGSSQSISGQKSRGALCRAESGSKRMPTSRCIPTEQYYIGKTVLGACFRPYYVFADISKLLVAAPVRFRDSPRLSALLVLVATTTRVASSKTPLALNPCLRISRNEDGGEISAMKGGKNSLQSQRDEYWEETISRVSTVTSLFTEESFSARKADVSNTRARTHTHTYVYAQTWASIALLFTPAIKCRSDELFPDCPAWYEFSRHPMIASPLLSLLFFRFWRFVIYRRLRRSLLASVIPPGQLPVIYARWVNTIGGYE